VQDGSGAQPFLCCFCSGAWFQRDISDEDVSSHDAKRLEVIFSELTACKDDSQQRSWALHEDEAIIHEYLQELLSILVWTLLCLQLSMHSMLKLNLLFHD
jgi:hypothetical protein